ncbi:hypothetical protein K1X12_02415 [Hyphomonas sp. WL0036]|uniref:hypothetical protein n=1 Tax=Hyphomonas sediminis TaxID=2866160 RepID=UPI001C7E6B26|nr:hypothetical protein [Hyphomonas sediminis]MBY9065734.1 hypothetical protein [Hyphomonas sediminis]
MIKARPLRSASLRPRAAKSPWRLARRVLLLLKIIYAAALCLAPGRMRSRLLHFVHSRAGQLEQIFRRLLLAMRAAPAAVQPPPFEPRGTRAPHARRAARKHGFSLSLKGILPDAAFATPSPVSISEDSSTATLAALPREEALAARLKNLQSVLEDCWSFSAKLQRRLARYGLRLRAPKAQRPATEVWALVSQIVAAQPGLPCTVFADTS